MKVISDENGVSLMFKDSKDIHQHVKNLTTLKDNVDAGDLGKPPYMYTIFADGGREKSEKITDVLKKNRVF